MRILKTKNNVFYVGNTVTHEDGHTTIFFFVIIIEKEENLMKKLILSFCVMCSILFTGSIVYAATFTVSDSEFFRSGYYDNAYATLSGQKDELTGKLTNVKSTKKEYGAATATFGVLEKKTTSAKQQVIFRYLGIESERTLSI